MIVKIRNAGDEREEEKMVSQTAHERMIRAEKHVQHIIALDRDNFQKLALNEGKERIKIRLELERMRSTAKAGLIVLAISMLANIGMVVCLTN